jgi:hypothetical protein
MDVTVKKNGLAYKGGPKDGGFQKPENSHRTRMQTSGQRQPSDAPAAQGLRRLL